MLVTGGRGWIGRACLELLDETLAEQTAGRVSVYGSAAGELTLSSGRTLPILPLDAMATAPVAPTLVAHFAYLTKEKPRPFRQRHSWQPTVPYLCKSSRPLSGCAPKGF